MEDNDIEFAPISEAHLPSWWKHTKEGKEVMDQITTLQAQVADLQEILNDKRRLTRELDIAMNGEEGAAQQASLCDLVEPARQIRQQNKELQAQVAGMREVLLPISRRKCYCSNPCAFSSLR